MQISLILLVDALEENRLDPLPSPKSKKKHWALLFDPEKLVEEHGELLIHEFILPQVAL